MNKESMFRRWIYLLSFVAVCAGLMYLLSIYEQTSWDENFYHVRSDECREYLENVGSDWKYDTDYWYQNNCDYENPNSRISYEVKTSIRKWEQTDQWSINTITLVGLIGFSFLVRWLLTGRVKFTKKINDK